MTITPYTARELQQRSENAQNDIAEAMDKNPEAQGSQVVQSTTVLLWKQTILKRRWKWKIMLLSDGYPDYLSIITLLSYVLTQPTKCPSSRGTSSS